MLFRNVEGDVRRLEGVDDHKKRLRRDDVALVHAHVVRSAVHGRPDFAVGKIELCLFQSGGVFPDVGLSADHGHAGGVGFRSAGKTAFFHFKSAGVVILSLGKLGLVAFKSCLCLMKRYFIGLLFNDEQKLSLLYQFAVMDEHLLKLPACARDDVHRGRGFHGADGIQHIGDVSCPGDGKRDQRRANGSRLCFFGVAGTAWNQHDTKKAQEKSNGHGSS